MKCVSMIAPRTSRTTVRILPALAASLVILGMTLPARAEGPTATDYCQKTTARAEGDAALLFAPTLTGQLIRFPNRTPADSSGFQIGSGVQPRAAMSISLVNIYQGIGVLDLAKKDCQRQESTASLEEVIAQRADLGRVPALERKIAFLRGQDAAVQEIVKSAEQRFAAHTSTISEVQEIRLHALSFARRLSEAEGELAIVKARAVPVPTEPLAQMLARYEQRSIAFEDGSAHLHNLDPWKLGVSGGVAATPSAQVYGVAELAYNLGGLFRPGAERRAVEARASELKNARYEMRQQIEVIARELRVSAEHGRREAKAIEAELLRMARDRASLDETDAPNKHNVVAAMTLQMIDLEAEQTFLTVLAEKQASFGAAK